MRRKKEGSVRVTLMKLELGGLTSNVIKRDRSSSPCRTPEQSVVAGQFKAVTTLASAAPDRRGHPGASSRGTSGSGEPGLPTALRQEAIAVPL